MSKSIEQLKIGQGPNVLRALEELDQQQKNLLQLFIAMSQAYEGYSYPVDLLATAAIKRSISTAAGFKMLVEARNILCSRALLRLQIDTALRFYSVFIVEKPHDYSVQVLSGKQIDQLKDKLGNNMKDSYLLGKLKNEYPWLETVYRYLSGYVHFSAEHFFSSIKDVRDDVTTIEFELSKLDMKFPEESWLEMIECFKETTSIFVKYLEGWIYTKANPEKVSELREKLKR